MGFLITTLIFAVIGIIACLCTRICCNRGPSANLYVASILRFVYPYVALVELWFL
ncbi:putative ATPase, V0 complex, subunit e1/e2 [Lupinus albus]|uniref:Putative ATPase, V0 complex, subunit e1/e2 n=1 Tax=Lupinus albus TaxID=3870 RepID=A0A6A4NGI3_LUPAL|nr:putative ATPase, V0 complex, subunit e1/e2 [Lupinus albus]